MFQRVPYMQTNIPYLTCYNCLSEDKPLGSEHVHVEDNVKIKIDKGAFRLYNTILLTCTIEQHKKYINRAFILSGVCATHTFYPRLRKVCNIQGVTGGKDQTSRGCSLC